MKYIDKERQRVIQSRDAIFRDSGNGKFMGKEREFVLSNPVLNLWASIRKDAINYFDKHKISWWSGKGQPTGHLLSSQIACLNHLYPIRQRKNCADRILQNIDQSINEANIVDSGFVEFEKTGLKRLGRETSTQRGANSTSIDGFMIGRKENGEKILILIEWKYTEAYSPNSLLISDSGKNRFEVYQDLLEQSDCPIITPDFKDLFYEPYYQLMRQTLLGWTMVNNNEYNATDWLHLHIIPDDNKELREKITSKNLKGKTLEDSWKNQLKQPEKYIVMSPKEFLKPIFELEDTQSLTDYLEVRYW